MTHPDGRPITKPSNFCRLCRDIIRGTDKGLEDCLYSDAVIGRDNPSGPIIRPCLSGGLWDGGSSISVGDKHIANWLIGQVRNETQHVEDMLKYAREIGADEEEFRAALEEVPVMLQEQFQEVGNALFLMANMMSQIAFQNLQQARSIADLKNAQKELQDSQLHLEAMNRELQRVDTLKDEFLANTSHELRVPRLRELSAWRNLS